jgi:cytochrome c5
MTRTSFKVLAMVAFLGCTLTVVARAQKGSATAKSAASDPGEQAFQHNCGRCHNAPESLSPREVKAVVRQMRVRAMLTQKDEQLILKYLAP